MKHFTAMRRNFLDLSLRLLNEKKKRKTNMSNTNLFFKNFIKYPTQLWGIEKYMKSFFGYLGEVKG